MCDINKNKDYGHSQNCKLLEAINLLRKRGPIFTILRAFEKTSCRDVLISFFIAANLNYFVSLSLSVISFTVEKG
jgi:hypothetical protein